MDWLNVFDDMAHGFNYFTPSTTDFSFSGQLVDTEKYDIVPKLTHYETLINRKQEELDALERQHENEKKYYKTRKDKLLEEKETLLRDRDNRTKNRDG